MSEFVPDYDINAVMMHYAAQAPTQIVHKSFDKYHDLAIVVERGYVARKVLISRMNLPDDLKIPSQKRRVFSSR